MSIALNNWAQITLLGERWLYALFFFVFGLCSVYLGCLLFLSVSLVLPLGVIGRLFFAIVALPVHLLYYIGY